MKFLLAAVNAKYIHSNPAVYSLRAYVGSDMAKHVEIAEYTINHRRESIIADIYKRKPDVIAFSCYIWNWAIIREILPEINKVLPGVPIWLGGPEVSFDAGKILEDCKIISGVMLGEGEETFHELLHFYLGLNIINLNTIAGITYRCKEKIITTAVRELTDINKLPFLYENLDVFENRIIYYESARGCPYRCSYCLSSIDKRVRLRNVDTVKKELLFFLKHNVKQVKFIDRTFNCNHNHTMEIWQYIYENDNGITNFHFEVAADIMREDELKLMSQMRPGLMQLEIGVQSANTDTLKVIERSTDMNKLGGAVKCIHEGKNIHIHLDLIAGLPYEDYESFGKSFNIVYAMRPHQLQLGFLKVLKGSPMHENAGKYGINYTTMPPYEVLYSNWLSYDNICRLKQIEEMVELYYNSNQFTHTLPVLIKVFGNAFSMYEKLADYYEVNGYFISSPSRIYRYRVLLAFAVFYDNEREALYKELLTYDMYLRENVKNRPDFAPDLAEYKIWMRNVYMKEETVKTLLPGYKRYESKQIAKMTHMDIFTYRVWEEDEQEQICKTDKEAAVIFDYEERNPLTNEAAIKVIQNVKVKNDEENKSNS